LLIRATSWWIVRCYPSPQPGPGRVIRPVMHKVASGLAREVAPLPSPTACTAGQRNQSAFDVGDRLLAPELQGAHPGAEWGMSREETIAYRRVASGCAAPGDQGPNPYSDRPQPSAGVAQCCTRPSMRSAVEPTEEGVYALTNAGRIAAAPEEPEGWWKISLFDAGLSVSLNGGMLDPRQALSRRVPLIEPWLACHASVGWVHHLVNRGSQCGHSSRGPLYRNRRATVAVDSQTHQETAKSRTLAADVQRTSADRSPDWADWCIRPSVRARSRRPSNGFTR